MIQAPNIDDVEEVVFVLNTEMTVKMPVPDYKGEIADMIFCLADAC